MNKDNNNEKSRLKNNNKPNEKYTSWLSRRHFLQVLAFWGGIGATTSNEKMIVEGSGIENNKLVVETGETYQVPSDITEQYSRVDVDGSLLIDGKIKIGAVKGILKVDSGETYHIPNGDTEQYSRVDVDGTLQADGKLKITA